jgi:hypothetical protein
MRKSQATVRRILSRARQDALDQSRVNSVCALTAKLLASGFAARNESISRIFWVRAASMADARPAWFSFGRTCDRFDEITTGFLGPDPITLKLPAASLFAASHARQNSAIDLVSSGTWRTYYDFRRKTSGEMTGQIFCS